MWFELDEKKQGGKSIIYRSYTIKSNYIKLNDCFKFGYDLLDKDLNPLIRFNTFDDAVNCVDRLSKWFLIIFYLVELLS